MRLRMALCALLGISCCYAGDRFLVLSPQAGFAKGAGFAWGATFSAYKSASAERFWGLGLGAYRLGDRLSADALVKTSLLGVAGLGAGVAVVENNAGPAAEIWANAVAVGVRYRGVYAAQNLWNSVTLFVPLCFHDNGGWIFDCTP